MAKNNTGDDNKTVLKRVHSLVKRAQNPLNDDDEEARTAAMQAANMMREHELILVPKSEIDRVEKLVRETQEIIRRSKGDGQQKYIVGALAGLMLGKAGILK